MTTGAAAVALCPILLAHSSLHICLFLITATARIADTYISASIPNIMGFELVLNSNKTFSYIFFVCLFLE